MNDIVCGTLQAKNDKQSRADSIRSKRWDSLQEVIETTTRTFKKVARRSSLLASAPARMNRRGSLPGTEPSRISESSKRRDSMFGAARSNSVYTEGSTSGPAPCTCRRRNSLFGGQPASVGMNRRGSLSGGSNTTGRRSSFFGSQPMVSMKRRGSVSTSLGHTKIIDAQPRRNSMFGAQPLSYDDARISGARTA
jgi:hypothetical protein